MNYFNNQFIKLCKNEFSKYGFKNRGKCFTRVINDVMQNFILKIYRNGRCCTVEFGMVPLCARIEKKDITSGIGIYNLRRFEAVHWTKWDHWEYDPNSSENIDACILELISNIKKYLIPLFLKADNCKKGYSELCEMERLFDQNRLVVGKKINSISEDITYTRNNFIINGIHMLDMNKFFMALKNGDYNQALAHLKAFEQQNMNSYAIMLKGYNLSENEKSRREEQIKKTQNMIKIIETKDEQYINDLIIENERYSCNIFKEMFN